MKKPFVSIARNINIREAVFECLRALDLPDLNGRHILLKPNVGREVDARAAINTNPDVVQAVFDFLSENFDATFYLGDSPIIMTDTRKAFKQSGYQNLINHPKIHWLDLDEKLPLVLDIPNGRIINQIRLTGYLNKFDYIVSIPVLKMHMHTGVTLSFKNLKGLIYKRDKINLHHLDQPDLIKKVRETIPEAKELDVAISDLYQVMKPDLSIIDASFAMGGMGPSAGSVKKSDIILASNNFLAADLMAMKLAQPDWETNKAPHLSLLNHLIYPDDLMNTDQIDTNIKNIEDYYINLDKPPTTISIHYPNVQLYAENSCSSCVSTVFLFLKNNIDFIDENFTEEKPLKMVIGKGNSDVEIYGDTFLVGNCTIHLKEKGHFIKGCPPVQSVLLKNLSKTLNQKVKLKKEAN